MNAATIGFPWSGMPRSPAASATGMLGGGATTPVRSGSGFNQASIVQNKIGGPVSAYVPAYRGRPVNASFVRYQGLRGLGQDYPVSTTDPTQSLPLTGPYYPGAISLDPGIPSVSSTTTPSTSSSSGVNWTAILAPLTAAGANIGTMFASYQNPLLNKATYYQTPQGTVYASNVAGAIPGITTNLSGLFPILLIGGGLVLLVSAMKR